MTVFSFSSETVVFKPPNSLAVCICLFLAIVFGAGFTSAKSSALRVGILDFPPSLGNPFTALGPPSTHFWGSLYDSLTTIADDGSILPALAVEWTQVEPNTWTVSLRRDVHFHNGAPFDVEAVVATITYLQSTEASRFLIANETKNILSVRQISNHEVEIVTREPDAILPRRLSLVKIIEPHLWTELGPEDYALTPIGTGPYAFSDWASGNRSATLTAFDKGLRTVKSIQRLVFFEVPNAMGREQALLSDELDFIWGINPDSVESIRGAGFDIHVHPVSQILSIALPNVRKDDSPLKFISVRQALNFAVDRQSIAEHIFGGLVEVAGQGAVAGTVGFNPKLEPYPYDPEEARRLLTNAGYPNGFTLTIGVLQAMGSGSELAYQKVGQDLTAVGIAVEVRAVPSAEFLRRFMSNDWGEYDAFSMLWNNEPMRDVGRALEYFSCLRPQPFFCDNAIADAIRISRQESDPEKRKQILQEIMVRMKESAPAIWLTSSAHLSASIPQVNNVLMVSDGLRFEEMVVEH